MGDRGNIYITNTATEGYTAGEFQAGGRGIYVYAHWHGSELPELLQNALVVGRGRWTDDAYLTRIIIDQVTKPGRDAETGFGVSLVLGDNEHPITVVDLGRREVAWAAPGDERTPDRWVNRVPFAEYVDPGMAFVGYPPGVRAFG
jgi:hypothetical protein